MIDWKYIITLLVAVVLIIFGFRYAVDHLMPQTVQGVTITIHTPPDTVASPADTIYRTKKDSSKFWKSQVDSLKNIICNDSDSASVSSGDSLANNLLFPYHATVIDLRSVNYLTVYPTRPLADRVWVDSTHYPDIKIDTVIQVKEGIKWYWWVAAGVIGDRLLGKGLDLLGK